MPPGVDDLSGGVRLRSVRRTGGTARGAVGVARRARCILPFGDGTERGRQLKWSRLFGQFEGFDKVYPCCEVTPSSSRLIISKMMTAVGVWESRGPRRRLGRQRSPARFPRACGRPPRRPSDPARRRPGVHRPGTSTARRGDAATAPVMRCPLPQRSDSATTCSRRTRAVIGSDRGVRMLMPHAPRRRLRPGCVPQEPSADVRGCRTSSTSRPPARPRTRRTAREDTQPRTLATATAAQ